MEDGGWRMEDGGWTAMDGGRPAVVSRMNMKEWRIEMMKE